MNKTIRRYDLVKAIHQKLYGAVSQETISLITKQIVSAVVKTLIEDQVVSVQNFGTLSPYEYHGHKGVNIDTGEVQQTRPIRLVRFRAHSTLLELLAKKRSNFLLKK